MHTVALVVFDRISPFEMAVPCEVFGADRSDMGLPNYRFLVCAAEEGLLRTDAGFGLVAPWGLDGLRQAQTVVVPAWRDVEEAPPAALMEALRRSYRSGARIVSLCSGAFVLAAAGLLDGERATTHWMYADTMMKMYPQIDVDPDVLYVQDGRIITSAGTAAGLDACLHLLRQELGAEMTNTIARRMVVPPQRDGGQAQFIRRPIPEVANLSLAPVTDWMLENLRMELTVDQLATKAHMSPRTFARRFKADYGTTPAAWLGRQRIIHAQRLLEQTDLGLDRIAYECGFGSASVLRQNFSRVLGTTPTAYRATFCCEIGMGGSALERHEGAREEAAVPAA